MPDDLPFPRYPTKGRVTEWRLTREQYDVWAAVWPTINVGQECRRAHQWILANPLKRKTAAGMRRFLVSWFSRQLERQTAQRKVAPRLQVGSHASDPYGPSHPYGRFWQCPHTPRCPHRVACQVVALRDASNSASPVPVPNASKRGPRRSPPS